MRPKMGTKNCFRQFVPRTGTSQRASQNLPPVSPRTYPETEVLHCEDLLITYNQIPSGDMLTVELKSA